MSKVMVISVGTGRGVEEGISSAIRNGNPDYIVFLVTGVSREKTVPRICDLVGLDGNKYECCETTDENDVEKCVGDYNRVIVKLRDRGYSANEIVCDFTSGTKAMSSALVVAGLQEEVGALSYVYGERGEDGRVISGTERPMSLEPRRIQNRAALRRAVELFNDERFNSCIDLIDDLEKDRSYGLVKAKADDLRDLAGGYRAWDYFAHEEALERLTALSRGDGPVAGWGLGKTLKKHKQILYQLKEDYTELRLTDLWNNMERRANEGRFDDAVARIYRLLEYLAQLRLYRDHGGLVSGDLEVALLPEEVRKEYEQRPDDGGKMKLDLMGDLRLLGRLGDGLGSWCFAEMWKGKGNTLQDVLLMRNESILAHGFRAIDEKGYKKAKGVAAAFMDRMVKDWEKKAREARFPKLDVDLVLQDR